MAKVRLNPILERIRGSVGDLVFKRYGDGVVVARKPDMEGREQTPAQLAQRERFRQAALFGKMVMADPDTKLVYDEVAQQRGKPVFSLTIADFYNAPNVDEIDVSAYTGQVGDPIVIRASDDFDVVGVAVTLTDTEGNLIEEGDATESAPGSGSFTYAATAAVASGTTVRIAVSATDRPGGEGQGEQEVTL